MLLEEINIECCHNLTDASCMIIADGCANLKAINFGGFDQISNSPTTSAAVTYFFNNRKHLVDIDGSPDIVPACITEELTNRRLSLGLNADDAFTRWACYGYNEDDD